MSEVRAVALALVALVGAFAVVAPASLAGPVHASTAGVDDPAPAAGVEDPAANDSSMGEQVSSFMHASSGQASEEVEGGMWNAAYENAANRSAVVDGRTVSIESRLTELRDRKQELIDAREAGTISRVQYRARMSNLVGRMAALNRSIADTSRQASATGVGLARVERLRADASNVTGPEMSETARSFAGGPPEGVPAGPTTTGPPDNAGPPDGSAGPGNSEQGPPGNESDPGEGNRGGPGEGASGEPGGGNNGGGNNGGGNDGRGNSGGGNNGGPGGPGGNGGGVGGGNGSATSAVDATSVVAVDDGW